MPHSPSEQPPSENLLTRLRRYAEQNKSDPWIPVKAAELMALVECAEALDAVVLSRDFHGNELVEQISAALNKVEDL